MPYRKPTPPSPPPHRLETWLFRIAVAVGSLLLLIWILQFLLPWLLLASLVGAGFWLWQHHQQRKKQLYQLFYDLIKARGGRIHVLDFAMAAQLTGREARTFLDARAREFFANFEPTDHGDILYTFPALEKGTGQATDRVIDRATNWAMGTPTHPPEPPLPSPPEQPAPPVLTESSQPLPEDSVSPPPTSVPASPPTSIGEPAKEALAEPTLAKLSVAELAERLQCSVTLLEQQKWAADFADWTKHRDPQGWRWVYDPMSDHCYPIAKS